ncbi:MAG: BON domain-containing protein, partial [Acidimicrobiia bacterium]|nr:BON domain-containing protein [Acidimicrobiia bacterium]
MAVLMAAAIVALLALSYRASGGSGDQTSAADGGSIVSDSVPSGEDESGGSDTEGATGSGLDATDDEDSAPLEIEVDADASGDGGPEGASLLEPPPAPESGPYVSATLDLDAAPGEGLMVLAGRVPDQATAEAVLRAAEISYAPFVESQLEIDETLAPAPWLDVAPSVIGLLPSVTDGTIMVADERILLSARSPNPDYLQNLQGGLALFGQGLSVELVDSLVTDLDPPLFAVQVDQASVTLDGFVPSQAVIELLAGGAEAAYGPDQVTNNLTVDDSTYSSFWMQTMPGIFQLFRAFPAYKFTVEDGQFSGAIQGGVNFAADSTEITPEAAQALDIGVAILARDPSVGMLVTG